MGAKAPQLPPQGDEAKPLAPPPPPPKKVARLHAEVERLQAEVERLREITGVLSDIDRERLRQNKKWGEQNHLPYKWMAILAEEVGEACKEVLENRLEHYREELVQVAAVAVAAIESVDRNPWMEDE